MRRGRQVAEFARGQVDADRVVAAASGIELPLGTRVPTPGVVHAPIDIRPELAA